MFKGFALNWGRIGVLAAIALTSTAAFAGDLSWDGEYRVEADKVYDSQMDHTYGKDKAYILHHFILQPKFVAGDGLTIYGRFDILNDSRLGSGNVAGQAFGSGIHNSSNGGTPSDPGSGMGTGQYGNNVSSDTQAGDPLLVSELYATWVNEFGVLVVGRAPLQFGLGMTYSAGTGLFDHFISTRDLIGYKIVLGNFFVMPMIGKTSEGALDSDDDVNDYMLQLQYDNPESQLSAGVFVDLRTAAISGNDILLNNSAAGPNGNEGVGGPGATKTGGFKQRSINVFISQKYQNGMSVGVEGGFNTGETGISDINGNGADISAFGVAAEIGYNPTKSKWSWLGKLGMASGDDPSKTDQYSGFSFNRNYDIGLLMFNYPLGQRDFLRTYNIRDTSATTGKGANSGSQLDDEAVSNAIYLSPNVQYKIKDNMSVGGTYVYGMLRTNPFTAAGIGANGTGSQSKNLGSEVDVNYQWKPYERLTWITEVGVMLPGAAWQGIENLSNKFVYGIQTKAAITF